MSNCLFCKIVNKEIKASIVYEDESVLAFNDIDPQAPVHILVIPKKHISDLMSIQEEDKETIYNIHKVIVKLAKEKNLGEGFRVVVNNGKNAGQAVFHIHYHVLGNRQLQWPPG